MEGRDRELSPKYHSREEPCRTTSRVAIARLCKTSVFGGGPRATIGAHHHVAARMRNCLRAIAPPGSSPEAWVPGRQIALVRARNEGTRPHYASDSRVPWRIRGPVHRGATAQQRRCAGAVARHQEASIGVCPPTCDSACRGRCPRLRRTRRGGYRHDAVPSKLSKWSRGEPDARVQSVAAVRGTSLAAFALAPGWLYVTKTWIVRPGRRRPSSIRSWRLSRVERTPSQRTGARTESRSARYGNRAALIAGESGARPRSGARGGYRPTDCPFSTRLAAHRTDMGIEW